jgi:hypothetical protein
MKNLFLLVALLILSSCEVDTIVGNPTQDNAQIKTELNQAIKPIVELNPAQADIAKRVCRHLRSQRIRLNSLPSGTGQNFRVREKACPNGQVIRNQVRAELETRASGHHWRSRQSINLHSAILTDRSSIFNNLCDDLDAGLEVQNTDLISSRQIQFSFQSFSSDDLDSVKLISYEMERGTWRAKFIDEYDIDRGTKNPNQQGLTKAQIHRYFCKTSQKTGQLWQEPI